MNDEGAHHYYDGFHGNCGMGVLYELGNDPEAILREFGASGWEWDEPAIVAFSDNHQRQCGAKLAKFIRKNKLGRVTGTREVRNQNSGNMIQAWYWCVDAVRFNKWLTKGK